MLRRIQFSMDITDESEYSIIQNIPFVNYGVIVTHSRIGSNGKYFCRFDGYLEFNNFQCKQSLDNIHPRFQWFEFVPSRYLTTKDIINNFKQIKGYCEWGTSATIIPNPVVGGIVGNDKRRGVK